MELKNIISSQSMVTIGIVLFLSLASQAFAAKPYGLQSDGRGIALTQESLRPFRVGVLRFNEKIDTKKPLASADFSGWVNVGDLLIGAINSDWLGAFSIIDKKPQWWLKITEALTIPPMVTGGWVIIASKDGKLTKVEAQSGKKVWELQLDTAPLRSPTKYGNDLIVATASQTVYNIDFQKGTSRWVFDTPFPKNLIVNSLAPPVVHERSIYLGSNDGEVISIDADSGRQNWKYEPSVTKSRFKDFVGKMIVNNGRLIFTRYDGLLGAMNIRGSQRSMAWTQQLTDIATSTTRSGILYVGCVNGDVYAFQMSDGRRLWRSVIGASVSYIRAGESMLYVASTEGRIVGLSAKDGEMKWHDDLQNAIMSPPVYIRGDLFFATGFKNLYGYKIK